MQKATSTRRKESEDQSAESQVRVALHPILNDLSRKHGAEAVSDALRSLFINWSFATSGLGATVTDIHGLVPNLPRIWETYLARSE